MSPEQEDPSDKAPCRSAPSAMQTDPDVHKLLYVKGSACFRRDREFCEALQCVDLPKYSGIARSDGVGKNEDTHPAHEWVGLEKQSAFEK